MGFAETMSASGVSIVAGPQAPNAEALLVNRWLAGSQLLQAHLD